MLARPRRLIQTAALAACLAVLPLTAACGAGLAGNQANPGGVQSAQEKGSGAKPGESAGTGPGSAPATAQAAGQAGAPIPTPGQTGPASGKPLGSPGPSPSPAAGR